MTELPKTGADWPAVADRMDQMARGDVKWRDGKAAVYVFNAGPEIEQVQKEAYARFASENGLGPAAFPSLKQMEAEVVMKGQQRVPELLDINAELDRQLAATKSRQSRNHVMGVLTAILGSAVLLAANVFTEKAGTRDDGPPPPPG